MNKLAFGLFQKFSQKQKALSLVSKIFANKKGGFGLLEIAAKTKKALIEQEVQL